MIEVEYYLCNINKSFTILIGPHSTFLKNERSKFDIADNIYVNLFFNQDNIKMLLANEVDQEQDGFRASKLVLISSLIEHDYNQVNTEPKGNQHFIHEM